MVPRKIRVEFGVVNRNGNRLFGIRKFLGSQVVSTVFLKNKQPGYLTFTSPMPGQMLKIETSGVQMHFVKTKKKTRTERQREREELKLCLHVQYFNIQAERKEASIKVGSIRQLNSGSHEFCCCSMSKDFIMAHRTLAIFVLVAILSCAFADEHDHVVSFFFCPFFKKRYI